MRRSALIIFIQTDWRLAGPLILWMLVYVSALFYFVPRSFIPPEDQGYLVVAVQLLEGHVLQPVIQREAQRLLQSEVKASDLLSGDHAKSNVGEARAVTVAALEAEIDCPTDDQGK